MHSCDNTQHSTTIVSMRVIQKSL